MPRAHPAPSTAAPSTAQPLVDDYDLDGEMVDALRDLSCHQNAQSQAMLDQVKHPGSTVDLAVQV